MWRSIGGEYWETKGRVRRKALDLMKQLRSFDIERPRSAYLWACLDGAGKVLRWRLSRRVKGPGRRQVSALPKNLVGAVLYNGFCSAVA